MPNLNDLNPNDISTSPIPQNGSQQSSGNINSFHPDDVQSEEEYFNTPGQQLKTAGEGALEGIAGPLAPAIERGFGVDPENIRKRAETNSWIHGGAEATTFAGSLLAGTGEAAIIGKLGEGAAAAAGLGDVVKATEAASQAAKMGAPEIAAALNPTLIQKVAASGIKTSAEMAALQTSDEISKYITQDPNQSLGTAAVNIGLSGILGGAGGAVVGSVSPLWKTAANKIGAEKVATDFMGETSFLDAHAGGGQDLAQNAANEVTQRMSEADQILNGGLKGKAIAKALPEATLENLSKIDQHLQDISDLGAKRVEEASKNAYLKGSASKLQQDLEDFQKVINDPGANVEQKWDALDQYKRASQGHADYNILTGGSDEKALSKWIKPFNAELREAAENNEVWGAAGDVQKDVNKATSELYSSQKDFLPKVTSSEKGERIADQTKLQTLINTSEKGKVGARQNAVKNYLKDTQTAADAINKAHIDNGLEAPLSSKLNPTPVLDHTLNTPVTAGRSLAQWTRRKGSMALANAAGETAAGVVGGGLGSIIGHPLVGAWAGERILSPVFSVLAKPFAENAINSEAMKSSIDYAANVAKGDRTLTNATKNIFKAGAEILPENLMPKEESREKLKKSLNSMNENPQNMFNVGGNIGHYLPGHAAAAGAMATTAQNYFNNLKPKQSILSPLDEKPPIDKMQEAKYNRALDIAQQPLMSLQHVKNGTLQPVDVQTLNTIYPNLHSKIVNNLNESLIAAKAQNIQIPYAQRQAMSMLMATPLDSTMTPQAAQAIMMSANVQQSLNPAAGKSKNHKASGTELTQINKVNSLYATASEQRQINKKDV